MVENAAVLYVVVAAVVAAFVAAAVWVDIGAAVVVAAISLEVKLTMLLYSSGGGDQLETTGNKRKQLEMKETTGNDWKRLKTTGND